MKFIGPLRILLKVISYLLKIFGKNTFRMWVLLIYNITLTHLVYSLRFGKFFFGLSQITDMLL